MSPRELAQRIGTHLWETDMTSSIVGGEPAEDEDFDNAFIVHWDGVLDLDSLAAFLMPELAKAWDAGHAHCFHVEAPSGTGNPYRETSSIR